MDMRDDTIECMYMKSCGREVKISDGCNHFHHHGCGRNHRYGYHNLKTKSIISIKEKDLCAKINENERKEKTFLGPGSRASMSESISSWISSETSLSSPYCP